MNRALVSIAFTAAFGVSTLAHAGGPTAVITTSLGTIKVQLDAEKAPISVKNFLTYAKAGQYDGTIFHRVIKNFMIQGGGLDTKMNERAKSAPIKNEHGNGLTNKRGTIAMARTNDPNSATAQFFINVKDNAFLDQGAGYAVFGSVVEGMEVVDKIVSQPTTTKGMYQDVPQTPIVIKKVQIVG